MYAQAIRRTIPKRRAIDDDVVTGKLQYLIENGVGALQILKDAAEEHNVGQGFTYALIDRSVEFQLSIFKILLANLDMTG